MKKLIFSMLIQLAFASCNAENQNYDDLLAQQLEQKTNQDLVALEQNNAQQKFFERRAATLKNTSAQDKTTKPTANKSPSSVTQNNP